MPTAISDTEKAYHEAGHAVMAFLWHVGVESATIIPDREFAGHVMPSPAIAERPLAPICMIKLAGAVAASMHRGQTSGDLGLIGIGGDLEAINDIVDLAIGSARRTEFLGLVIQLTLQLLAEYWNAVVFMANVLLVRKTLSGPEARSVFLYGKTLCQKGMTPRQGA